jgi:hypothetical protein
MERELEIEHRLTKVEEAVSLIPKMAEQMEEMSEKFAKYEGRWGAITLVGAGIWGLFAVFKDDILKLFGKG